MNVSCRTAYPYQLGYCMKPGQQYYVGWPQAVI